MTDDTAPRADALRLGEDAAHRLLARAVELDAAPGGTLTLAQLREVAREAGISADAFEAAVRELGEAPGAPAAPVPGGRIPWRTAGLTAARNALGLAGGWAVISAASAMTSTDAAAWRSHQGAVIAGNVLAVLLARRLGARAAAVLWAVTAAAQAGEYPIHLLLGIGTVQGGPTKFALLLASLLGIGFGALLRHARRAGGPASPPAAAATSDAVPNVAPAAERPRLGSLRLRHA